MELIESLQGFVGENLELLAPVEHAWQPTDLLPDLTAPDWTEQLGQFREAAMSLSDEVLVVLVGNMVTEEALPSYTVSLEQLANDPSGIGEAPWARWLRGWTAEENRHGDLLNAYLRLSGRVDMQSIERTIHHLITNGFASRGADEAGTGLIYAAFQERATRITHGNVAKLASRQGDANLARICRKIAGDEARHETFYTRVVGRMMDESPESTILAFRGMLKGVVEMPASRMYDGKDPNLFDHFAVVAQRAGAYTVGDYAQIIEHLIDAWDIPHRSVTGKAAKAQDYLCKQAERYEFFADEVAAKLAAQPHVQFSWIHGREV
jgi:acyl-[acyl-carrier-protein] desaturase